MLAEQVASLNMKVAEEVRRKNLSYKILSTNAKLTSGPNKLERLVQPCLMFVGKAKSLPYSEAPKRCLLAYL